VLSAFWQIGIERSWQLATGIEGFLATRIERSLQLSLTGIKLTDEN